MPKYDAKVQYEEMKEENPILYKQGSQNYNKLWEIYCFANEC